MDESSSDSSLDEEEILKNFDQEARIIVQTETLPKKSSDRYLLVYNNYKKWQEENKNSLSRDSEENNLIVYFNSLKPKLKPPTLWSIWSMLRTTLNTKDNIDIKNFLMLKSILKNNNKGYKPKKSLILKWSQIMNFMTTADDHVYLAIKVILIFGICGALRCAEITNMKIQDVEDLGDKFLISIQQNKNEYPGQFVIGKLFYNKVKTYILLRPTDQFSDRFFIHYNKGKCTRQVIGRHKIGEIPEIIASYLGLENPKRYTGHCFRRTSATLLSESGANMQTIKQLGRWRSDIIAQGYIENSINNRQLIFEGITHEFKTANTYSKPSINNTHPEPSTSKTHIEPSTSKTHAEPSTSNSPTKPLTSPKAITVLDESDFDLKGIDFTEEFTANKSDPSPGEVNEGGFSTANNKKILTPPMKNEQLVSGDKKLFHLKPPVQVKFDNQKTIHLPLSTKRKILENSDKQNESNDVNSILKKHCFKNCNFNNCVFNISISKCDKENSA